MSGFRWGEEAPDCTGYRSWEDVRIVPDEDCHSIDRERLKSALDFLAEAPTAPWCLTVGFIYPHYPQVCTQSAFARVAELSLPRPVPRERLHARNVHWSDRVWGFDRFDPAQVDRARRCYLAMVCMLDDWVGQLLHALEDNGLAEDTVVVYTSDHGDMWGEHQLWGKNLFYEESARVPMLFCGPGIAAGQRLDTPVSLVDFFPTFADIAGVDWPASLDGRSLWPAIAGGAELPEEPVFCEYYASDTAGPERMIRHGDWKLNYYHRQGIELFNLCEDPRELHDRAEDPACAAIRERLLEMLCADWDVDAIDADVRADQQRRSLIGEARRRC